MNLKGILLSIFKPKVKLKELMIFSRQFASMINAGMSLTECLSILSESENPTLREAVGKVKEDVEQGKNLADALAQHPKIFDDLYVSMIEAAQISGELDTVLNRLSSTLEKSEGIRRKVKGALLNPMITIVMALVITALLIRFVVPMFVKMLTEMNAKLPGLTITLRSISKTMQGPAGIVGVGVIVILVFIFKRVTKTEKGGYQWDKIKLKLPLFGDLMLKSIIARSTRIFSLLSKSGVPLLQVLEIVSKTAGNRVVAKVFLKAQQSVNVGESLSKPLIESRVFPPMVTQMLNSSEKAGALEETMDKIADFYEEEVDRRVKALQEGLKPITTFVLGGIILSVIMLKVQPPFYMTAAFLVPAISLGTILIVTFTFLAINFFKHRRQILAYQKAAVQELQDARQMQLSLLPESAPALEGIEIAGKCISANTVGGDFFDYLLSKRKWENEIGIVIADVTGKGLKGAMNAVMVDGILHAIMKVETLHATSLLSPASLLMEVNDVLKARMERDMNVTMVICLIDAEKQTLTIANAGHHIYPILLRDGELQFLRAKGLPVGMKAGIRYSEEPFPLGNGDAVIFMTDGIIEARDKEDKLYLESGRLEKTICQFGGNMNISAEGMVDAIIADTMAFSGDKATRDDDITVVVAKVI